MDKILDACIPAAAEPNWWGLLSIACGIFIVGMCLGALVGAAIAHDAYAGVKEPDIYDPRWPQ
jgi:hypothetical protein